MNRIFLSVLMVFTILGQAVNATTDYHEIITEELNQLEEIERVVVDTLVRLKNNAYVVVHNKQYAITQLHAVQEYIGTIRNDRRWHGVISEQELYRLAEINQYLVEYVGNGVRKQFSGWPTFDKDLLVKRSVPANPSLDAVMIKNIDVARKLVICKERARVVGFNTMRQLVRTIEALDEEYGICSWAKKGAFLAAGLIAARMCIKSFSQTSFPRDMAIANLIKASIPPAGAPAASTTAIPTDIPAVAPAPSTPASNPILSALTNIGLPLMGTAVVTGLVSFKTKPLVEVDLAYPLTQLGADWKKFKAHTQRTAKKVYAWMGGTPSKNGDLLDIAEPRYDFTNIIGHETVINRLTTDVIDPLRRAVNTGARVDPIPPFLFVGYPGSGKTFIAEALCGELKKTSKNILFLPTNASDIKKLGGVGEALYYAQLYAPCVLFIDEIDLLLPTRTGNPEALSDLLTSLGGVQWNSKKPVIVIAATNKPDLMDFALFRTGRFETVIHMPYPTREEREKHLRKKLDKESILISDGLISQIVDETEGHPIEKINSLTAQAIRLAPSQLPREEHFVKALNVVVKGILPLPASYSAQEKRTIAAYQAGQALATMLLDSDHVLSTVTVCPIEKQPTGNPDNWEVAKQEHGGIFTHRIENTVGVPDRAQMIVQAKTLLAGPIAQQQLLNTQTYNKTNEQKQALELCLSIETGGLVLGQEKENNPLSRSMHDTLKDLAYERKCSYEIELKQFFAEHKEALERIYQALLDNNTLSGAQVKELINQD